MIKVQFICSVCGKEKIIRYTGDLWPIELYPPNGWSAKIDSSERAKDLLCGACCRKDQVAWSKANPDTVLIA